MRNETTYFYAVGAVRSVLAQNKPEAKLNAPPRGYLLYYCLQPRFIIGISVKWQSTAVSCGVRFTELFLRTKVYVPFREIFSHQYQIEQIYLAVAVAVRRLYINVDCPFGKAFAHCD